MPSAIPIKLSEIDNFKNYKVFTYAVITKVEDFNVELVWESKKIKVFVEEEKLKDLKEGDLVYIRGNVKEIEGEVKFYPDLIKKSSLKNKESAKKILESFKSHL